VFLVGVGASSLALVFDTTGRGWLGGVCLPIVGELILELLSECVCFGWLVGSTVALSAL
jgi:hypothetical protein